MKFGEHLKENIEPEFGPEPYLDYGRLDEIITELSLLKPSRADERTRTVSMTAPPQTNQQGLDTSKVTVTQESFLTKLEHEMAKVEKFTVQQVTQLRQRITDVEQRVQSNKAIPEPDRIRLQEQADIIANDFLKIEKYVNINFMGFHKILKKHDKNLSDYNPCKAFYVNRLHSQSWVRGDYSDVVVRLSTIYAALRDDKLAADNTGDASQSFTRTTTKYWVKTEDVSRVKYAVLRHLPVFLQKTSTGESDSQFTNSVYLDNDQLELYHGRLDKTPGAIALRMRWYGPGDPKTVFVERKTHNEKWMGEASVKERFIIDESEVQQVLTNTYPIQKKKQEMIKSGKSQKEADEWEQLVTEITQVISTKQLVPTVRTQCMRTAFQIPFDATVRVSLDTNLCMLSERGYDLQNMSVWHRDKSWVLEDNEITRFPHAVLEIKLEMRPENMAPPQWVTDLQNSGLLYECHKYSKYVHGCAVLLPEDVQAVPFWIDDISIRQSIIDSEGQRILSTEEVGVGPGANDLYNHMLPFGTTVNDRSTSAVGRTSADKAASKGLIGEKAPLLGQTAASKGTMSYGMNFGPDDIGVDDDIDIEFEERMAGDKCSWPSLFCQPNNAVEFLTPTSVQKIEPKVFFANERTFLHWLHHAVILSSVAGGILSFSHHSGSGWAEWYALALLPISLGFCVYALNTFIWRADRIKTRIPGRWDDSTGPMLLGSAVVVVLTLNFFIKLYAIAQHDKLIV